MRPTTLELLRCPLSGGELAVEVLDEGPDGAVEHGLLRSEAGTFPVVAGIPVFRPGAEELVDLVRAGEHDRAALRAAFGEVVPAGWHRLGDWLSATSRLRPVGRRIRDRHEQARDLRARPLVDAHTSVRDLFALAYRDLHLRNPEVFAYNWYRFGLPRHLAALAVVEWAPTRGPVLDVGCGAGHLTWSLTEHVGGGGTVLGIDGLFFALHVAKTRIAPAADFVCCELEALPLRDGAVGGVWASDVLHAVSHKASVARELRRVAADDAWGAVVGLAVAGHEHEYPGRPLSTEGYRSLFPGAEVVGDDVLLAGYLDRRAADPAAGGAGSATVTALWDPADEARPGEPFAAWPHGRGDLVPNPLLTPTGRGDATTRVALRFPTDAFEREHGALRAYTPATAEVPDAVAVAARAGERTPEVEALVDDLVLVGVPPGYVRDPWAGFVPGA
jgi:SAM-dependent methyltransferase